MSATDTEFDKLKSQKFAEKDVEIVNNIIEGRLPISADVISTLRKILEKATLASDFSIGVEGVTLILNCLYYACQEDSYCNWEETHFEFAKLLRLCLNFITIVTSDSNVFYTLCSKITEVMTISSEKHSLMKNSEVKVLSQPVLDLILNHDVALLLRRDVVKVFNAILSHSDRHLRMEIASVIRGQLSRLAKLLMICGDYEFQAATLELVFRFISIKTDRHTMSSWFDEYPEVQKALLNTSFKDFESECRTFLNLLNSSLGDKQQVFTLPCARAFVGDNEIFKPKDDSYKEFWIDFNMGSKTVSIMYSMRYDTYGVNWELVSVNCQLVGKASLESGATSTRTQILVLEMLDSHDIDAPKSLLPAKKIMIIFKQHSAVSCLVNVILPTLFGEVFQLQEGNTIHSIPMPDITRCKVSATPRVLVKKPAKVSCSGIAVVNKNSMSEAHLSKYKPLQFTKSPKSLGLGIKQGSFCGRTEIVTCNTRNKSLSNELEQENMVVDVTNSESSDPSKDLKEILTAHSLEKFKENKFPTMNSPQLTSISEERSSEISSGNVITQRVHTGHSYATECTRNFPNVFSGVLDEPKVQSGQMKKSMILSRDSESPTVAVFCSKGRDEDQGAKPSSSDLFTSTPKVHLTRIDAININGTVRKKCSSSHLLESGQISSRQGSELHTVIEKDECEHNENDKTTDPEETEKMINNEQVDITTQEPSTQAISSQSKDIDEFEQIENFIEEITNGKKKTKPSKSEEASVTGLVASSGIVFVDKTESSVNRLSTSSDLKKDKKVSGTKISVPEENKLEHSPRATSITNDKKKTKPSKSQEASEIGAHGLMGSSGIVFVDKTESSVNRLSTSSDLKKDKKVSGTKISLPKENKLEHSPRATSITNDKKKMNPSKSQEASEIGAHGFMGSSGIAFVDKTESSVNRLSTSSDLKKDKKVSGTKISVPKENKLEHSPRATSVTRGKNKTKPSKSQEPSIIGAHGLMGSSGIAFVDKTESSVNRLSTSSDVKKDKNVSATKISVPKENKLEHSPRATSVTRGKNKTKPSKSQEPSIIGAHGLMGSSGIAFVDKTESSVNRLSTSSDVKKDKNVSATKISVPKENKLEHSPRTTSITNGKKKIKPSKSQKASEIGAHGLTGSSGIVSVDKTLSSVNRLSTSSDLKKDKKSFIKTKKVCGTKISVPKENKLERSPAATSISLLENGSQSSMVGNSFEKQKDLVYKHSDIPVASVSPHCSGENERCKRKVSSTNSILQTAVDFPNIDNTLTTEVVPVLKHTDPEIQTEIPSLKNKKSDCSYTKGKQIEAESSSMDVANVSAKQDDTVSTQKSAKGKASLNISDIKKEKISGGRSTSATQSKASISIYQGKIDIQSLEIDSNIVLPVSKNKHEGSEITSKASSDKISDKNIEIEGTILIDPQKSHKENISSKTVEISEQAVSKDLHLISSNDHKISRSNILTSNITQGCESLKEKEVLANNSSPKLSVLVAQKKPKPDLTDEGSRNINKKSICKVGTKMSHKNASDVVAKKLIQESSEGKQAGHSEVVPSSLQQLISEWDSDVEQARSDESMFHNQSFHETVPQEKTRDVEVSENVPVAVQQILKEWSTNETEESLLNENEKTVNSNNENKPDSASSLKLQRQQNISLNKTPKDVKISNINESKLTAKKDNFELNENLKDNTMNMNERQNLSATKEVLSDIQLKIQKSVLVENVNRSRNIPDEDSERTVSKNGTSPRTPVQLSPKENQNNGSTVLPTRRRKLYSEQNSPEVVEIDCVSTRDPSWTPSVNKEPSKWKKRKLLSAKKNKSNDTQDKKPDVCYRGRKKKECVTEQASSVDVLLPKYDIKLSSKLTEFSRKGVNRWENKYLEEKSKRSGQNYKEKPTYSSIYSDIETDSDINWLELIKSKTNQKHDIKSSSKLTEFSRKGVNRWKNNYLGGKTTKWKSFQNYKEKTVYSSIYSDIETDNDISWLEHAKLKTNQKPKKTSTEFSRKGVNKCRNGRNYKKKAAYSSIYSDIETNSDSSWLKPAKSKTNQEPKKIYEKKNKIMFPNKQKKKQVFNSKISGNQGLISRTDKTVNKPEMTDEKWKKATTKNQVLSKKKTSGDKDVDTFVKRFARDSESNSEVFRSDDQEQMEDPKVPEPINILPAEKNAEVSDNESLPSLIIEVEHNSFVGEITPIIREKEHSIDERIVGDTMKEENLRNAPQSLIDNVLNQSKTAGIREEKMLSLAPDLELHSNSSINDYVDNSQNISNSKSVANISKEILLRKSLNSKSVEQDSHRKKDKPYRVIIEHEGNVTPPETEADVTCAGIPKKSSYDMGRSLLENKMKRINEKQDRHNEVSIHSPVSEMVDKIDKKTGRPKKNNYDMIERSQLENKMKSTNEKQDRHNEVGIHSPVSEMVDKIDKETARPKKRKHDMIERSQLENKMKSTNEKQDRHNEVSIHSPVSEMVDKIDKKTGRPKKNNYDMIERSQLENKMKSTNENRDRHNEVSIHSPVSEMVDKIDKKTGRPKKNNYDMIERNQLENKMKSTNEKQDRHNEVSIHSPVSEMVDKIDKKTGRPKKNNYDMIERNQLENKMKSTNEKQDRHNEVSIHSPVSEMVDKIDKKTGRPKKNNYDMIERNQLENKMKSTNEKQDRHNEVSIHSPVSEMVDKIDKKTARPKKKHDMIERSQFENKIKRINEKRDRHNEVSIHSPVSEMVDKIDKKTARPKKRKHDMIERSQLENKMKSTNEKWDSYSITRIQSSLPKVIDDDLSNHESETFLQKNASSVYVCGANVHLQFPEIRNIATEALSAKDFSSPKGSATDTGYCSVGPVLSVNLNDLGNEDDFDEFVKQFSDDFEQEANQNENLDCDYRIHLKNATNYISDPFSVEGECLPLVQSKFSVSPDWTVPRSTEDGLCTDQLSVLSSRKKRKRAKSATRTDITVSETMKKHRNTEARDMIETNVGEISLESAGGTQTMELTEHSGNFMFTTTSPWMEIKKGRVLADYDEDSAQGIEDNLRQIFLNSSEKRKHLVGGHMDKLEAELSKIQENIEHLDEQEERLLKLEKYTKHVFQLQRKHINEIYENKISFFKTHSNFSKEWEKLEEEEHQMATNVDDLMKLQLKHMMERQLEEERHKVVMKLKANLPGLLGFLEV